MARGTLFRQMHPDIWYNTRITGLRGGTQCR